MGETVDRRAAGGDVVFESWSRRVLGRKTRKLKKINEERGSLKMGW